MPRKRPGGVLGPRYEMIIRDVEGNPAIQARTWDPESGLQIVLTFPANGERAAYERFKSRLARSLLGREEC